MANDKASGPSFFHRPLSLSLAAVALSLAVRAAASWIRRRRRWIEIASKLPGKDLDDTHPWLADMHEFLNLPALPGRPPGEIDTLPHIEKKIMHYSKRGHRIYRIWAFNPRRVPFARVMAVLWDPDLIAEVVGPNSSFAKGRAYVKAKPLVGDSVLSLPDGQEWKRHRKLAAPGFSHSVLANLTVVVGRHLTESLFPKWDADPTSSSSVAATMTLKPGGRTIDVVDSMSRFALDVLGEVAFSHSFGGVDAMTNVEGKSHHYDEGKGGTAEETSLYKTFEAISVTILQRCRGGPLRHWIPSEENSEFRRHTARLESTLRTVISERLERQKEEEDEEVCDGRETSQTDEGSQRALKRNHSSSGDRSAGGGKDLLAQLLLKDESGDRLNDKYILGNTRTFLFAGHDTTSSALSFGLYQLAMHPHVCKRLRDEVDPLFANDECPSYADLRNLRYLDAVTKEILRLHPAGVIGRTATKDVTIGAGGRFEYLIPEGTEIVMYPWFVHRHPDHWNSPNIFLPDRFLDSEAKIVEGTVKNSNKKPTMPFLPFSVGHRSCIGKNVAMAEIRAVIAHVVHRYLIFPCKGNPDYKVQPFMRMTVNPVQIELNFQLRTTFCHSSMDDGNRNVNESKG